MTERWQDGPWVARRMTDTSEYWCAYWQAPSVEVYQAISSPSDEPTARLIAAAPEMLKALDEISNGEGIYGMQAYEYKKIARTALAKARPEEKS